MKIKDIRKKNDADLRTLLGETRKLLMDFRFDIAGTRAKNTKEGKAARKNIARMLTDIKERELQKNAQ